MGCKLTLVVLLLHYSIHFVISATGSKTAPEHDPSTTRLNIWHRRKIKDVNGKDKKIRNTFIVSTFNKVKGICKEEQRVYKNDNLYRSSEEMELLHCTLQYDKRKYEGVKIKKHIEIACEKINKELLCTHCDLSIIVS
uniref:Ribonuclease A-domain domain-containing protein n=1 Tax=Haplochromis burtoni TaxID=8153 RepID=A0A3Q2WKC4_HAPBU